jgi:hypothetical protein
MANSEGGGRRWLTCGCFGCLGLIGLVLIVAAVVFGTAWIGVRHEQIVEQQLAPEMPAPEPGAGGAAGRVVLRLSSGEFHLRAGEPGEPPRVEAAYDDRTYELRERFEPGPERWTYELEFWREGSWLLSALKAVLGGKSARVAVYLPPDVPLELIVELRQTGSELDIGGLWLTSAEVSFNQGGFELAVSEPLREPMERLVIRGSMGGFATRSLGDASPRRLEVEMRMGGMELDLRGGWRADAEISIDARQGGTSVRLPHDVNIVGIEAGRTVPQGESELPRPTLTFAVSSQRGEIEFD